MSSLFDSITIIISIIMILIIIAPITRKIDSILLDFLPKKTISVLVIISSLQQTWRGLVARNLRVTVSPLGSLNRRLETGVVHSDPGSEGRWSIKDNRWAWKPMDYQGH